METDTLARLSEIDNIVAVKDSTGSLDRVMDVIAACGDQLAVLSGDDSLTLAMIAMGARGAISALSNVIPREMAELTAAALEGRFDDARAIHYRILPVLRACFLETNPIPIKAAVAMLGGCRDELRLPLQIMSPGPRARLRAALLEFGLAVREAVA
jgi:4-hydroxy-tetrahydrodipicolinate synthase